MKSFGKWDLGPVAYYATDVSHTSDNLRGNQQFALGAFAGYGFGPLTVQTYLTHDVMASGGHLLGGEDTRFFLRFIVPLWNPKS